MSWDHQGLPGVDKIDFQSKRSLLGYDIVIIDFDAATDEYTHSASTEEQFLLLDEEQSDAWWDDISRRRSEIIELLEAGKTIVILTPGALAIKARKKKSAKSQAAPKNAETSLFDVLPVKTSMASHDLVGANIVYVGDGLLRDFAEVASPQLQHSGYLSGDTGKVLFRIKDSKRVVGCYFKHGPGTIIFAPGCRDKPQSAIYIEALIKSIENQVHRKVDHPADDVPDWCSELFVGPEKMVVDTLRQLLERLTDVNDSIAEARSHLDHLQALKSMLYATGKPLEHAVALAFQVLGCEVQHGPENRDDLILSWNGRIAVVEVKGFVHSAGERDAMQLEKWVSNYAIENEAKAKGLLLVNAYRKVPPHERHEPAFPHQMLEYSVRRSHCLMTTAHLLSALYSADSPEKKAQLLDQIFATDGIFEGDLNAIALVPREA